MTSSGIHTLKWRYVKDSSGDDGDDCGWVDPRLRGDKLAPAEAGVQWTGASPVPDSNNWQQIDFKYDVAGRRSEKIIDGYPTRYLYDGPHVIAEYDGNNNLLRKYIYGPGVDQPISMIEVADSNATYYYHYDALGSVIALSDSSGDTVQTYEYSVFGEVAVEDANHTNPYMFAGRRYDIEIGLYYNRARYYNPFTGRFLQTDPIGYEAGMNLYTYCGNNPVRLVDPSGLRPTLDWDDVNYWSNYPYNNSNDSCNVDIDITQLIEYIEDLRAQAPDDGWIFDDPTDVYSYPNNSSIDGITSCINGITSSIDGITWTAPSVSGSHLGGGIQYVWLFGQGVKAYTYGQAGSSGAEVSANIGGGIVMNCPTHKDFKDEFINYSGMVPTPIGSFGIDHSFNLDDVSATMVTWGLGGGLSANAQYYVMPEEVVGDVRDTASYYFRRFWNQLEDTLTNPVFYRGRL